MQVTYETKIKDFSLYPTLEAYTTLYGQVERALFRDLHVRKLPINDLKQQYQPRFGITARQFNSLRVFLDGKVKAVREGLALRLSNLREKVKSTDKAVNELTKKLAQIPKGKKPIELGCAHKLKFKLHHKKRRLHLLQTKLTRLEAQAARPVPRLTFGSNKLFRAQFHLQENGYSSHQECQTEWDAARSSQFVCVGSKDETGGNQSCIYSPDTHSLRLRLPYALIPAGANKYLTLSGIAFRYGEDVIRAALACEGGQAQGQALTYRFIRRRDKSRTGRLAYTGSYSWYVQITTERVAAPKTTDRRLGAIGLDLNPALVAIATIDRYGNPIETHHFPVQLHKRSSEQIEATLADVVARVVLQARTQSVPIVIERLDFTSKKNELREKSNRYARMLSSFAYKKFHDLIHSRASREGVEIIEVNPAFTSVIGLVKFKSGYGLSTHAAAAVAIARRGKGFGEALRSRAKPLVKVEATSNPVKNALLLPVRSRVKHVGSDWRKLSQRLRTLRTLVFKVRGRPPSEGTSGGSNLVELSSQTLSKPQQVYSLWL